MGFLDRLGRSALWRWTVKAVLWLGIVLCVLAVIHGIDSARNLVIAPRTWLILVLAPLASWIFAVAGWRELVAAHIGERAGWKQSLRQSGLLLVGKYVPGGVFGFLARLYDAPAAQRSPQLAAGLAEQLLGVLAPVFTGGVCYLAAANARPGLLTLLFVVPVMVTAITLVASVVLCRIRRVDVWYVPPRRLLIVSTLFCLQQLMWAMLAWQLARDFSGASDLQALGIAGCFGLAVAAGMIVVVAPGGIGVREGALVALAMPWATPEHTIVIASLMRLGSVSLDMLAGLVAAALKSRGDNNFDRTKT